MGKSSSGRAFLLPLDHAWNKKSSGPHNSRHWLLIPASQHNQTISPLGWLVTSQSHGNVPSCLQYNTILPCAASSRYFLTELIPSCRCANMNWTKNGHCCHGESLLLIPVIIQATGGAEKGSVAGVLTSTNIAGKQQLQKTNWNSCFPPWMVSCANPPAPKVPCVIPKRKHWAWSFEL